MLQTLIERADIRVGIVSRNVTIEPEVTLATVLVRHDIDAGRLDFIRCIPLGDEKLPQFRALRDGYGINPARAYACGDEYRDYTAALGAGMHPLVVSYGFEDHGRLTDDFGVPPEVISRTPDEFAHRLRHALDLDEMSDAHER